MALVTPLLLTLMFGSFELGNYFMDNHVVAKAVRDGARYASRLGFNGSSCDAVSANLLGQSSTISNITRTGEMSGGNARLPGWTNAMITVAVDCRTGGAYAGIYSEMTGGVPVVIVSADVPYNSLFGAMGFRSTGLMLRARSESAVMGL